MGHKPRNPTLGTLTAITPFLALAAIAYFAALIVLGRRPDPADVELAFTAGPGVLLVSIAAGVEQWRRRQARTEVR